MVEDSLVNKSVSLLNSISEVLGISNIELPPEVSEVLPLLNLLDTWSGDVSKDRIKTYDYIMNHVPDAKFSGEAFRFFLYSPLDMVQHRIVSSITDKVDDINLSKFVRFVTSHNKTKSLPQSWSKSLDGIKKELKVQEVKYRNIFVYIISAIIKGADLSKAAVYVHNIISRYAPSTLPRINTHDQSSLQAVKLFSIAHKSTYLLKDFSTNEEVIAKLPSSFHLESIIPSQHWMTEIK